MPRTRSRLKSLLCFSADVSEPNASARKDDSYEPLETTEVNGAVLNPRGRRRHSTASHSSEDSKDAEDDLLSQLRAMKIRDFQTLKDVALKTIKGGPVDDKSYLMERIIQLATDLPYRSSKSETLTKSFLTQLWDDLEHPPKSYLGNKFTFRQADGSMNNILWPHVGAAGQPYARTVRPRMMQPVARPDPGVLFDALLSRKAFIPHPNSISSVLFYVASIIIHDIFHTSHKDFAISETSSYLDLAPLYGSNQEQQMLVRTGKDGKLKADCFSDVRILGFPPGVGVLLIFFNRFHNHVVENLAKIDENGRFSSILRPPGRPAPSDGDELYDEALFQTGRLVTTGLYINIILYDYVRNILHLNSVNSKWNLDPRSEESKSLIQNKIPEALGNQVSAEFNLVYRWHSCISERDEAWTEATYKRIVGDSEKLSMSELLMALQKWAAALPTDPQQRPFHDLERNPDGRLPDEELASIWIDSVEDVAGSFGALHVPKVMRSVEMLGIIQARTWNLASLNEFREYFKLTPHEKFEDINPDPYVVETLRNLYGHPDHVELYPGVILESSKKSMSPGSGLCTNFTISRAILSDAVALVRSDRYHTVDHTPQNLTNWGFNATNYDVSIDYGCVFHKLVLQALPNHFPSNSIYAHYPLVTPTRNRKLLGELKQAKFYKFERPNAAQQPRVVNIHDPAVFVVTSIVSSLWSERRMSIGGPDCSVDSPAKRIRTPFVSQVAKQEHWGTVLKNFFKVILPQCWKEGQYRVGNHHLVDLLRDVVNLTYTELLKSMLSISEEDMQQIEQDFDGEDLRRSLSEIFDLGFAASPGSYLTGRQRKRIAKLATLVETKIGHAKDAAPGVVEAALKQGEIKKVLGSWGHEAMICLRETGTPASEIAWDQVLPDLALIIVAASQMSAQVIEALLAGDPKQTSDFKALVAKFSEGSTQALMNFIKRLTSDHAKVTFATNSTTTADGDDVGQTVIYNLSGTVRAFSPEMEVVEELHEGCMSALIQAMALLEGLEPAPGSQGQLKQVRDCNGSILYLDEKQGEYSHCPTMLKVRWEAK